ncbi:GNAT family N-acetyltransferase [Psychrobacillus soli]|uniref:GNAT family N-acetyltransferase n=1 Tax=Psychrobacillus soli TaxID=1543965 RepID=A0A544TDX4_9BACI|nr:GNAT family N-acetyltransferase [Psychrobacillus soli]TQR15654.1 GNAT family N-acetyltransferase [Psychrobacillus soli]
MNIRFAERRDIEQLTQMRWDFTLETHDTKSFEESDFELFELEFRAFLENAISSGSWFIWVVEEQEKIVSHIYIELIQKVPRPGRITYPFAFMTNVFTVQEFRNKGIGSNLIKFINEWAKSKKYEFIIVWPSDESISYYKKNGYRHCKEPMEFFPS